MPTNSKPVLLEALLNPENDVDKLLRIIDQNLETMTSFYLGVSFEALDDVIRYNNCDPTTVAVSPEFERLCAKTLIKVRFFEAEEVLKLIMCLSHLRLSENLLICQAALQMARHLINDFNRDESDTLVSCLDKFQIEDRDKSFIPALKEASQRLLLLSS